MRRDSVEQQSILGLLDSVNLGLLWVNLSLQLVHKVLLRKGVPHLEKWSLLGISTVEMVSHKAVDVPVFFLLDLLSLFGLLRLEEMCLWAVTALRDLEFIRS